VPFRSVDELRSPDNVGGTWKEECFIRKLFREDSESEFFQQLAVERNFSPAFIKRMMAAYRRAKNGQPEDDPDSVFGEADVEDSLGPVPGRVPQHDREAGWASVADPNPESLAAAASDRAQLHRIIGLERLKARSDFLYPDCRKIAAMTPSQKNAHFHVCRSVLSEGRQGLFFLTGAGGTGKSDVMRAIVNTMQRANLDVLVTATSGLAGSAIGGQTWQSALGVRVDLTFEKALNPPTMYRLQMLNFLVVDEVSMLSLRQLDVIDRLLRAVRKNNKPFGGVSVLLCGDFYQLGPVINRAPASAIPGLWQPAAVDDDGSCFSHSLWTRFQSLVLLENCRQAADPPFAGILNRVRVGIVDSDAERLLAERTVSFQDGLQLAADRGWCVIAARNNVIDEVNTGALSRMPGLPVNFPATDHDDACKDVRDQQHLREIDERSRAPRLLSLKANARVIVTRNLKVSEGVTNGLLAFVDRINEKNRLVVLRRAEQGGQGAGEPIFITDCDHHVNRGILGQPGFMHWTRKQLPLMLSFAATVHKIQGKGDSVVLV
jgi:hypothetical protein